MSSLNGDPRLTEQVVSVYTDSLRLTWVVAITLAGFGFLIVFLQREVKLRIELETEFGLVTEGRKSGENRE